MLTFYINRAGKNLGKSRLADLKKAKIILSEIIASHKTETGPEKPVEKDFSNEAHKVKGSIAKGILMAGRLDGRTAVVTGSGSGIGQAIAERLASEGANCVIDYVNHVEEADQTLDKIKAAGGKAVPVQADVSVVADCNRLIETAWTELGSCDILVITRELKNPLTSPTSPRQNMTRYSA